MSKEKKRKKHSATLVIDGVDNNSTITMLSGDTLEISVKFDVDEKGLKVSATKIVKITMV